MPADQPCLAPPSVRAVYALAWPMTLKEIMLHGTVVIDAFLVAGLGEDAIAAMGLASAVTGLMLGVLGAFSNAGQIRLAQAYGAASPVGLKTGFYCGLGINLALAVLGLVGVWLGADRLIGAFAHTPAIGADAKGYLYLFMVVALAEAVALTLSTHFNACGETRLPFYSYILAFPVNVVVSIVLIYGLYGAPQMGVMGAAAGSVVAALLRMGFLALYFQRRYRRFLAVPGWLGGGFWPALRRHLAFALPIAATFISAVLATSVCKLIYAMMPVNAFAAMTLIAPWIMVAGTIGMSWAQATGIIVAQLLGQKRPPAVLHAFLSGAWRAGFVAAGAVSLLYLAVCLSSGWLYGDLHPETRATLLSFLPVLLVLPFPKGSNAICGNTLRAGGETVYVMHVFVWSQWLFRVPLTALMVMVFDLSVTWVFSLFLLEELVKFPAFHRRLFRGDWKRSGGHL